MVEPSLVKTKISSDETKPVVTLIVALDSVVLLTSLTVKLPSIATGAAIPLVAVNVVLPDDVVTKGIVGSFLKKEIDPGLLLFAIAISGFPSPSKSPTAIPVIFGLPLVVVDRSTFDARLIVPDVDVLRKIETVFEELLPIRTSGFPSPSISAKAAITGAVPVVKVCCVSKFILPLVDVL